jgi:hypothetical protein
LYYLGKRQHGNLKSEGNKRKREKDKDIEIIFKS